ncbi:MAG: Rab family GTPase [Spirochaetota bacterium]
MPGAYKWKVVMMGDFAVGKTSLVRRFVYDEFSDSYLTTVGVKVTKKEVSLNDNDISLLLWDIAGSDNFNFITAEYLRGGLGGIIVADITRERSLESIPDHIDTLLACNPSVKIIVALNKLDLVKENDERLIYLKSDEFRKSLNGEPSILFTSALSGENVEILFLSLADKILKSKVYE